MYDRGGNRATTPVRTPPADGRAKVAKKKWDKVTLKINKNHNWRAKPGYNVFVANRGAVQFAFPEKWVIVADEEPITFYNRPQPDDDCKLQVSVLYLPRDIDWKRTSLLEPYEEALSGGSDDGRDTILGHGPVVLLNRPGMEIAWGEARLMDPIEHRESRSRTLMAHREHIQVIITLDYWPEDAERFVPVWDEIVSSLRLGQYMADPRQGPPPD
ncbi:MAG: hypothetical protein ACYDCQ_06100 [Dehalococcoidia bacterium]